MADDKTEPNDEQQDANDSEPTEPQGDLQDVAAEALETVREAISEAEAATNPDGAEPMPLPNLESGDSPISAEKISLLADVNLNVKIELGRTRMLLEDVLKLAEGAVVELDKLAGDPVDVYVNDRHIARGEVLVLNDNFCVRINEILNPEDDNRFPKSKAG